MSKYSLSAASLILAVPAGYLAYLLVMTFLDKPGFDNLSGFFQIIAGLTLALVAVMVLMPFGILIFFGKATAGAVPGNTGSAANQSGVYDDGSSASGVYDDGSSASGVYDDGSSASGVYDDGSGVASGVYDDGSGVYDDGSGAWEDDGFDDFDDEDDK